MHGFMGVAVMLVLLYLSIYVTLLSPQFWPLDEGSIMCNLRITYKQSLLVIIFIYPCRISYSSIDVYGGH